MSHSRSTSFFSILEGVWSPTKKQRLRIPGCDTFILSMSSVSRKLAENWWRACRTGSQHGAKGYRVGGSGLPPWGTSKILDAKHVLRWGLGMGWGLLPGTFIYLFFVWGWGTPLSPLVNLLSHLLPFLLFSSCLWLYLFSSFIHPFPFYQNSPTPFPGRRS